MIHDALKLLNINEVLPKAFLWCATMMTSSDGNIFSLLVLCEGNPPVNGGFPSQRPVMLSFDVFFDLRLNKRWSKQSRRRWFETPSRSLWRHCNGCFFSYPPVSPIAEPPVRYFSSGLRPSAIAVRCDIVVALTDDEPVTITHLYSQPDKKHITVTS